MSITLFFVDAFTSALDRGIASANDLIRHVTPDVLAGHLPRHLWARLLTACLGASRVDANTIIDTVGIPNLCEHMPKPLLWTCLAEIAATALGGARLSAAGPSPSSSGTWSMTSSINSVPSAIGSPLPAAASGPMATTASATASMVTQSGVIPTPRSSMRGSSPDVLLPPPPASSRPATNPGEPILPASPASGEAGPGGDARNARPAPRGLGTSRIASAGASSRRPQAQVPPPGTGTAAGTVTGTITGTITGTGPVPTMPSPRSTTTPLSIQAQQVRRDELDFEIETDLRADWKGGKEPIPVDDEQLVDWSANEETASGASLGSAGTTVGEPPKR